MIRSHAGLFIITLRVTALGIPLGPSLVCQPVLTYRFVSVEFYARGRCARGANSSRCEFRCVRTCLCKWRIKKPFITRARAGAAKKAPPDAVRGRGGASLSYLEPFPVNLGPPFVVVVTHTRVHALARTHAALQRECTHARATACTYDGVARRVPLPVRVLARTRVSRRSRITPADAGFGIREADSKFRRDNPRYERRVLSASAGGADRRGLTKAREREKRRKNSRCSGTAAFAQRANATGRYLPRA